MHIGICTPFDPHSVADLLDEKSRTLLCATSGAISTPVTPLVREWLSNNHVISIYSLDSSVKSPIILSGIRISVYILPRRRSRLCLLDLYATERSLIQSVIIKDKPDVISAQWSYEYALAALDCHLPTVVTCHDAPLRCAWICKSFYMTYHLVIAFFVIRRSQNLVCVSPYTADHVLKVFRPKAKISIIPNGLPEEIFQRGKDRLLNDRITSSTFTICSISNWGNLKNIKTLIKAFALLRQRHAKIRLVLFGSQLGPNEMGEIWARSNRFNDGVEFRGVASRRDLLDFLENKSDVMMHPSKNEAHGMVLLEAMACGVPVIAGQQSGAVPWTLNHGKSGILCDVTNPQIIADSIEKIILNPQLGHDLAEHGWKSTYERFRVVKAAAANEKLLMEIAANTAR